MTTLRLEEKPAPETWVPAHRVSNPNSAAMRDWARLILATLSRVVVFTLIGGVFWSALPLAFGWKVETVMSDSMAPRILAGDIAVSVPVPPASIEIGRVILFQDPDHPGRLRFHRLVKIDGDHLVTKGDANAQDDSTPITPSAVVGVGVIKVPYMGLGALWLADHDWLALGLGLGVIGLAVAGTQLDSSLRRRAGEPKHRGDGPDGSGPDDAATEGAEGDERDAPVATAAEGVVRRAARIVARRASAHPSRSRGRRSFRRSAPLTAIFVGSTAVALLLSVSTGAYSAFSAVVSNPTNALATAADYACWNAPAVLDSPIVDYQFNDAVASTTPDSSGNNRTGTLGAGATRTSVACGTSPAIHLDGTTASTVTAGGSTTSLSGNFSMEAWVQASAGASGSILSFRSSGDATQQLYMTNGRIGLYTQTFLSSVSTTTSASYADGTWHHIVATGSNLLGFETLNIYVDSASSTAGSTTSLLTFSTSVTGSALVGYDSTGNVSGGLVGNVDDAAIYSSTLSSTQVKTHMATTR